jgi:hypothetical protein
METIMAYFQKVKDSCLRRYDHLIVHCTATKPSQKNVDAAWVDNLHKNKGWSGCGYHAVITRSGDIQLYDKGYPARPVTNAGAHVGGCGPGWNRRSFGVCLAGGVDENNEPENNFMDIQFNNLSDLISDFLDSHPSPETIRIMGHRDLIRMNNASPKACPCFDVADFLSDRNIMEPEEDIDTEVVDSPLSLSETYKVKSGDTLWRISKLFGVSVGDLKLMNSLPDDTIYPDQILKLR